MEDKIVEMKTSELMAIFSYLKTRPWEEVAGAMPILIEKLELNKEEAPKEEV